ncbi:hypothetical protein [Burkholderia anthina]|uniref:hypothetical protein n=1 Tax=Burkholderia anthina TaxID=179879 RepID=UPI003C7E8E33
MLGDGRFVAYPAGSRPKGEVNPFALRELARRQLPTERYRCKSRDEFAAPDAPMLDFVFTVQQAILDHVALQKSVSEIVQK